MHIYTCTRVHVCPYVYTDFYIYVHTDIHWSAFVWQISANLTSTVLSEKEGTEHILSFYVLYLSNSIFLRMCRIYGTRLIPCRVLNCSHYTFCIRMHSYICIYRYIRVAYILMKHIYKCSYRYDGYLSYHETLHFLYNVNHPCTFMCICTWVLQASL